MGIRRRRLAGFHLYRVPVCDPAYFEMDEQIQRQKNDHGRIFRQLHLLFAGGDILANADCCRPCSGVLFIFPDCAGCLWKSSVPDGGKTVPAGGYGGGFFHL